MADDNWMRRAESFDDDDWDPFDDFDPEYDDFDPAYDDWDPEVDEDFPEDDPDMTDEEFLRRMIPDFDKEMYGSAKRPAPAHLSEYIRNHPEDAIDDWLEDLNLQHFAGKLRKKERAELVANEFLMSTVMRGLLFQSGTAYFDILREAAEEEYNFFLSAEKSSIVEECGNLPYIVSYSDQSYAVPGDVAEMVHKLDRTDLREDILICEAMQHILESTLNHYLILPLEVLFEHVRIFTKTDHTDHALKQLLLRILPDLREAIRLDGERLVPAALDPAQIAETERFFGSVAGELPYQQMDAEFLRSILQAGYPEESGAYQAFERFLMETKQIPGDVACCILAQIHLMCAQNQEDISGQTAALLSEYGISLTREEAKKIETQTTAMLWDTPIAPLRGHSLSGILSDEALKRQCRITDGSALFAPDDTKRTRNNGNVVVDMRDYRKKGKKKKSR